MDLEEIKELVDDAEASTSATREEAGDMLVFGRISQWDDDIGADVQTEFRGTFDIIKSRRNRILGELWSNPVGITFKGSDGAGEDAAETLTGMYRTDMLRSEEAIETALQDQVDCGFGAFRFVTEYESKFDDLNNYQRIIAEPINEANNVVYFDSNAKKKDKSDARWCAIITTFTEKGWERYADEMGIDYEANKEPRPFRSSQRSDAIFWRSKTDEIKVAEFYSKEKKRERVLIFEDPLGQTKAVYQREVKDVIDDMERAGFVKVGEKMKERWVVTKEIVTGEKVLKKQRIPGEHIPIIPLYGDWSRVEGREIWRGIYHDAQDGQRLHNFTMSYMADIVAKGPRQKPMYFPGQIQGFEYMHSAAGSDNNFPYLLMNEVSPITEMPYPQGPASYIEPPQLPQAAAAMLEFTRRSVDDVTGGALSQEQMMSGQVTEGQINSAQSAQNMETFLYQNSFALAMKQAGRVYASMASELYDVPREAVTTQPDGTESSVTVMETVFDEETGQEVVINDITRGKFEVYADVGPNFQSQKEEARSEMRELYTALQGTPEGEMVLLTYFTLMEGPKTDHLKAYARKRLVMQGLMEPDTDEEKQMMQQASQQQQQPDANMVMAMAEQTKAEADMAKVQMDGQHNQQSTQIKLYEAMTKRVKVEADAQKQGYDAQKTLAETEGVELENIRKQMEALSDQDLFNIAAGGQ
jgi:hypothetical protein